MKKTCKKIACKNTFKNKNEQKRKDEFNKRWIRIVNHYEKGREYY